LASSWSFGAFLFPLPFRLLLLPLLFCFVEEIGGTERAGHDAILLPQVPINLAPIRERIAAHVQA
jgi:hypothetical protein